MEDPGSSDPHLLEVRNLKTYFYTDDGVVKAVDGVDFSLRRGEVLGLVGESGCGKSVTSLSILRLVEQPGRILEGRITFDNRDLLSLSGDEMERVRGNRISMIFQHPQSALNPVFRVGDQIAEVLRIHQGLSQEECRTKSVELLRMAGIPDAERRVRAYPHELSGGMAQRVMIAMALACEPEVLIADEPTTALDVTIQAQILDLIQDLRTRLSTAVILITHDLGVIAETADRVAVMYAGRIVEQGAAAALFAEPRHPYTRGLLASVPVLGQIKHRLDVIPGTVPNLIRLPAGCRFAARCPFAAQPGMEVCRRVEPDLYAIMDGYAARCWLYAGVERMAQAAREGGAGPQ